MNLPGVGQLRYKVQLLPAQGHGGGIDHQDPVPVALENGFAPDRVVLLVFDFSGQGVVPLAAGRLFEGGDGDVLKAAVRVLGGVGSSGNVGQRTRRLACGQAAGDLPGGPLPHAIDQQVRPRVKKDGAADRIIPVVVVGEPPQAGLQSADDHRRVRERFPGPVGVDDGGPVGAQAHFVPGAVGVGGAAFFGGSVVGHHGVDVAAADKHAVPGLAHSPEGVRAVPVRLGKDGGPIALRLQAAGNDGCAEGGMVHVGVGGDHQEVVVPPVPGLHLLAAYGEEVGCIHSGSPV